MIFTQKNEILPQIYCSISMKIGYAQLHMMVNSCINFHLCWVYRFLNLLLTKLNSHNLWFSDKKTPEILPKNKCWIFIKTRYAQQHMLFNNCVKYHWCWLNSFWNLLHYKIEFSKFVIFAQKTEIWTQNNCSIFKKIYRCLP